MSRIPDPEEFVRAATGAENVPMRVNWTTVNPVNLQFKPVPEREWIVQDWLPARVTTANYGDGGIGKTLLAQQLQMAAATGTPWCGLAVTPCRSIGLYCEDDEDELHRRQAKMCDALGVPFADLGDMRWISGVGHDNALAESIGDGRMTATSRLGEMLSLIEEHQAKLLVLDTAADLFIGNENDRGQVRQFVGFLNRIAKTKGCTILLNAHPSRSGLASGAIDGGSTAWSNTVRSRWSLARPDGEEIPLDTVERVLTRRKANYAATGETIRLRWSNGVLVPLERLGSFHAMSSEHRVDEVFMALLEKVGVENRPLSDSRSSGNFAPRIFGARPDAEGFRKADFDKSMQRLFANGKIRMEDYGRPNDRGHPRRIIAAPVPAAAP